MSASISVPGNLRRAPRAATAVLASAALVLGGALATAPSAHAADDDASVSGFLTSGGTPLVDDVVLHRITGGGPVWIDDVETDEAGAFAFDELAAGTYTLEMDGVGAVREQFLGGAPVVGSATTFTLTAGQARTNLAFVAASGVTVSGTIASAGNGPADGAEVALYARDLVGGAPVWAEISETETDENGAYEFTNVLAGTYTVGAWYGDLHAYRFFGNVAPGNMLTMAPSAGSPSFAVGGSAKTGADITLPRAAELKGRIKLANGEAFVGDVLAVSIVANPWGESLTLPVTGDGVDEAGRYSMPVQPGTYTLAFLGENALPQTLGGYAIAGDDDIFTMLGMPRGHQFTVSANQTKTINTTLRAKPYTAKSVTKVSLSKSSRSFGTSSTASVSVAGVSTTAAATGSVRLTAGTRVIGTAPVTGGTAKFVLPANLSVGKQSLKATYISTGALQPSIATASLNVTKVASTTTARSAAKSATAKKAAVEVTVKATGAKATGEVKVFKGKKVVGTGTLTNGEATVKLSKLKAGKNKVTVKYVGSATVKASKSAKVTVKVKR